MMINHLAVTLITTLSVLVLAVACANGNGSTSPPVTQDVLTSEVAEQANDEGVFLRVIAPLDEARGYCLDIPGHMAGVRLNSSITDISISVAPIHFICTNFFTSFGVAKAVEKINNPEIKVVLNSISCCEAEAPDTIAIWK